MRPKTVQDSYENVCDKVREIFRVRKNQIRTNIFIGGAPYCTSFKIHDGVKVVVIATTGNIPNLPTVLIRYRQDDATWDYEPDQYLDAKSFVDLIDEYPEEIQQDILFNLDLFT